MTDRLVVVHPDAATLAASAAARMIALLQDVQASVNVATVALTGGGSGIAVLEQVAASPLRDLVDWSRVEIFWGDERFVPADDPERNAKQAWEALLSKVGVDPARVHEMPASDGEFGDDVDAATHAYAVEPPDHLDLVLIGVGGEGHVLSVFPDSPAVAVTEDGPRVVAVRDCPKPPPTRISLTLPYIQRATQVWALVSGDAKAEALARAAGGEPASAVPVAGAVGRERTVWLLDTAAASQL
ncbi:6-phosphogluconolactonase [Nakamurella sp. A5-74]|uniref:6-phosphogluconolactonase n=1 Tax=Nakamurella sp. A5-74 TaxID=3158264 RepID=A0AAU8DJF1_9ACTN